MKNQIFHLLKLPVLPDLPVKIFRLRAVDWAIFAKNRCTNEKIPVGNGLRSDTLLLPNQYLNAFYTDFMKSTSKLVLASATLGVAALFTGCGDSMPDDAHALYQRNNQGFNFMGIVDSSPASYEEVSDISSVAYSDDLADRKNISGDNISLFWGTFVYADY